MACILHGLGVQVSCKAGTRPTFMARWTVGALSQVQHLIHKASPKTLHWAFSMCILLLPPPPP
jgi:hypothetical protein